MILETFARGMVFSDEHGALSRGRRKGGGQRGTVGGFTASSRLRLLRTLHRVRRFDPPYFVTATYRDYTADFREWKRHLHSLQKVFTRAGCCGFWRLEFQVRGAPHFHLVVWANGGEGHNLLGGGSLGPAWCRIIGDDSRAARDHALRVEPARSVGNVFGYLVGHSSKSNQDGTGHAGRYWGLFGRSSLVTQEPLSGCVLDGAQWNLLRRVFRRYCASRGFDRTARRFKRGGCVKQLNIPQEVQARLLKWLRETGVSDSGE